MQVALANNGTIYVSDGYCNARVMEYEPDGTWRGAFDLPAAKGEQIPHSLAIDECQGELYVAARETGLVHAFDLASRRHKGVKLSACCSSVWCAKSLIGDQEQALCPLLTQNPPSAFLHSCCALCVQRLL